MALDQTFKNPEGHYSFSYPNDFIESPKLLKTHKYETFLKSEKVKGFTIGVSVDPVRINSLLQFTTPEKLGQRVLAVEQGKEGFLDGKIIATAISEILPSSAAPSSIPAYDLEYRIESSRGLNHFNVRSAIKNKLLFVLTVQSKEENYPTLSSTIQDVIASFRVDL